MTPFSFTAMSLAETDRLGSALMRSLPDTITVGLCGTLGAGKTRLVQAMAGAIGIPPDQVVSPTFVLCQHYQGARTLYHMDVYRLHDEDEFEALGPEEYFAAEAVTVIEWADRVEACLPLDRLMIRIELLAGDGRTFHFSPHGEQAEASIRTLRAELAG